MDGRRMGTVKTAAGPALLMAYIFLCAAEDLKYREISVGISMGFAFAGLVISAAGRRDPAELATALLPGLIALILSRAAGGSIGTGDALFLLVCAAFADVREIIRLAVVSMMLCSVTALIIIVKGNISCRNVKNERLPYLAFMVPALIGSILASRQV